MLGDFYFQEKVMAGRENEKFVGIFLNTLKYYAAFLLVTLPVFSIDMILAATYAAIIHLLIAIIKCIVILNDGQLKEKHFIWK